MVKRLILVGLLLITILTLLSCDKSDYREYTFNKGVKFSFEYPNHYSISSVVPYKKGGMAAGISFIDKIRSEGDNGTIYVTIEDRNRNYKDAQEAIEYLLLVISKDNTAKIVENSSINVTGVQAELIVYSYKSGLIPEGSKASYHVPRIAREVFFNYGESIWNISMNSHEERAEQAAADFNHLIQTFNILE